MALTGSRDTKRFGANPEPSQLQLPVAAATTLYLGGLVCDNGSGYAVPGSVSTSLHAAGVLMTHEVGFAGVDNSAGSAGDKTATVDRGAFWLANSSGDAVAITDRFAHCYIEDDETVSASDGSGTRSIAGLVLDVDSVKGVNVLVGAAQQALVSTVAAKAIQKRTVAVVDGEAGMTGTSFAKPIGAVLPANAVVIAHEVVIAEQFSGASDLTATIGGTDADAICASTDIDALAAGSYSLTVGAHPQGSFSAQQLNITLAAADLSAFTAGALTVNVWFHVLA